MKKKFILISILLIFFCGCKKGKGYKDRYTLVPDKERIDIGVSKYSKNLSICIQYITDNDNSSNYLAIANQTRNSIEIYNLDNRKLFKEIVVKIEGNNSFYRFLGFIVKNMDTVIVVSQLPQLVGLINGNGDVLKKISYSKDINGRVIQMTFPLSGQRPFIIGDTLILSQPHRADESSGILTSVKQKHSYLNAKVDLKTGGCQLTSLVYPEEIIGRDILGMEISRVIGFNDYMVYHFGIINGLFVSYNKISFEKIAIETNYQLKLPGDAGKHNTIPETLRYDIARDMVQDIYYDRYRECYYLIVRQREENLKKNTDFGTKFLYPHCFIIILDKKFNHMGDVYFPDDTYSFKMMFITPKGIYISEDHVNNPTFSEDYMRFRLFTLEKINNLERDKE